jgi:hypothetical protein
MRGLLKTAIVVVLNVLPPQLGDRCARGVRRMWKGFRHA